MLKMEQDAASKGTVGELDVFNFVNETIKNLLGIHAKTKEMEQESLRFDYIAGLLRNNYEFTCLCHKQLVDACILKQMKYFVYNLVVPIEFWRFRNTK